MRSPPPSTGSCSCALAYHASDAQLRQAVEDIRRRGLALAVEAGPLDPPPECGQGTSNDQTHLHTFDGVTQDSDVLIFTPAEPLLGIRYIWIDTTRSPSWVAWREIEVIAP